MTYSSLILKSEYKYPVPTLQEEIISLVCVKYKLTLDELKSPDRKRVTTEPRCVIMYLLNELTSLNNHQITAIFNRDHAMVHYAKQYCNGQIDVDVRFKGMINEMRGKLK